MFSTLANTVTWTDEKLKLVWNTTDGGRLQDLRIPALAPEFNPFKDKSGIVLQGSPYGIADGTNLGVSQVNEKTPAIRFMGSNYAVVPMNVATNVQFEGDLKRPDGWNPIHYWSTWHLGGGRFEQKVTLKVNPVGIGVTWSGLTLAADFDTSFTVGALNSNICSLGLSHDWSLLWLGSRGINPIEVVPRWGYLNTGLRLQNKSPLFADLSSGVWGLSGVITQSTEPMAVVLWAGHQATDPVGETTLGNSFVRTMEFVPKSADSDGAFLTEEYLYPFTSLWETTFTVQWFPHSGNYVEAVNWIRSSGIMI